MSTRISLDRILMLRVPVAWHEAVAVAQEVARETSITGINAGLDNCFLLADGSVEIGGASRMPFAFDAAAGTLDALLDRKQAPPELVAMLDRAENLEAGGNTDLASELDWAEGLKAGGNTDLASELAFFARPDAPATISALAARALAADADSNQQTEFDKLRKDVSDSPSSRSLRALASPRALGSLARAAVVLAMIVAVGAFALSAYRKTEAAPPSGNESAAAPAPLPAEAPAPSAVQQITGRIESLLDKGLETLGLRAAEASAPAAPAAAEAPARKSPPARRAVIEPTRSALLLALPPVFDPLITAADGDGDAVEATPSEPVENTANSEVEPPVLRWPQLPNAPGTVPVDPTRSYLELSINEVGTVDKIRLHSPRNSFHDRMLVSAAKAWVFHPAQKDGRPVKYLMKVPIE